MAPPDRGAGRAGGGRAEEEEDTESPRDPEIEGVVVWRSPDGTSSRRVPERGLSDPAGFDHQFVVALYAARNGLVVLRLDASS
ncbi:MAG TPA: hypothetical protein VF152_12875 [Acidimicrobiia bacterium]